MAEQNTEINIRQISLDDNLAEIAASIIPTEWGEDNELSEYKEKSLREIVGNPDCVYLIAYDGQKPVGIAMAAKFLNPSAKHWLYVDELGVRPDYRRRGIAGNLLKKLLEIAKDWQLDEVWLGTEPDNVAANHLYKSLQPSKVESFVGYTFNTKTVNMKLNNN